MTSYGEGDPTPPLFEDVEARNKLAGEQIAADEKHRKAEFNTLIQKYATWTPGLRVRGSQLLLGADGAETLLGITTNGVLKGMAE